MIIKNITCMNNKIWCLKLEYEKLTAKESIFKNYLSKVIISCTQEQQQFVLYAFY